jgi:hypothetical protein
LLVGLLGGLQVTPRGLALPFRRAAVSGHVAEALLDREFVDFGGAFVRGAGLIMAKELALACVLIALLGALDGLRGALDVLLRDGLPGGEIRPPAQQLARALGGLISR